MLLLLPRMLCLLVCWLRLRLLLHCWRRCCPLCLLCWLLLLLPANQPAAPWCAYRILATGGSSTVAQAALRSAAGVAGLPTACRLLPYTASHTLCPHPLPAQLPLPAFPHSCEPALTAPQPTYLPTLPHLSPPHLPPAVNYRLRNDHLIKLSISHALAQSSKLSVYEDRVTEIVESTKNLPETLAATGEVRWDGWDGWACGARGWLAGEALGSMRAARNALRLSCNSRR